jgi:hypothetical protein
VVREFKVKLSKRCGGAAGMDMLHHGKVLGAENRRKARRRRKLAVTADLVRLSERPLSEAPER